jgi:hypothetical protein
MCNLVSAKGLIFFTGGARLLPEEFLNFNEFIDSF